ncbi:MAG: hypothetical protein ACYSTL_06055, partial [Planctomycetota bacterium]
MMGNVCPETSESLVSVTAEAFSRVKQLLREMGLNCSRWDVDGNPSEPLIPTCELCSTLCDAAGSCESSSRNLAERIVAQNAPAFEISEIGCCVLGVPVYHRRRQTGAIVACFPIRQ